jgi:hypothetical protein
MSKTPFPIRIRSRIAELERLIAEAQNELDELRVAERVIARLGSANDELDHDSSALSNSRARSASSTTVSSKIVDILTSLGPMSSNELLGHLQEKWRPDLLFPTMSSTLSRIKAQGLVIKSGDKWAAAQKDEAPELEPREIPHEGDMAGSV